MFMNAIVLLDFESKNFEGSIKGFEKFRLKTVFFFVLFLYCPSVMGSQHGCEIHNSCEN